MLPRGAIRHALALAAALCSAADCTERGATARAWAGSAAPQEVPQLLNRDLPFRYPARLYVMQVQGNVTLHLHVTSTGHVLPESTSVAESSGQRLLDSAAVADASRLEFRPARRNGAPVSASILFPVYYRHPNGPPLL